jgi:hypothetical protein
MRDERPSCDSSDDEDGTDMLNNRYATAETPLLGRDSPKEPRNLYRQNVTILIFAFIFIGELASGLSVAPTSALMENIICRSHYPDVTTGNLMAGDPRCKEEAIQGTLATIRGWAYTFDCIPGILGAVPYGIMSDKWGRKPVFVLSIFGILLSYGWICIVCRSRQYFELIYSRELIRYSVFLQHISSVDDMVGLCLAVHRRVRICHVGHAVHNGCRCHSRQRAVSPLISYPVHSQELC